MSQFSKFSPLKTGFWLAIAVSTVSVSNVFAQTRTAPKSTETSTTPERVNTNTATPKPDVQSGKNNVNPPQTNSNNTAPTATPTSKPAVATGSQLPIINDINLVLKLKERRVYVYQGEKILAKYPVAIGKRGRETPTGEWQVMEKIKNPGWTSFKTGELMAPGKENPLGSRWIGFWTDGRDMIGFHGTPKLDSIGKAVSNGCVRMYNRDVKKMYKLVKVGTIVRVVDE
jgi:lipoprotein-anchoring transpeptidase ErfK/SrfK